MWLMTGLHSERFKDNVIKNINSFIKYDSDVKILVVLQNGIQFSNTDNVTTIKSEPGVIRYLQTGLNYLRANSYNGEWFARFDSDDLYSHRYLAGIYSSIKPGVQWSYIESPYVKVGNSLIYCEMFSKNTVGLGGTLASKINCAVDFIEPNSDDATWCRHMRKAGYKPAIRGPEGFALLRHENHNHVFPMPTESIIHAWSCNAYDQKSLDIDKSPTKDCYIENNPFIAIESAKKLSQATRGN